ncbi:uncharacterized protein LOC135496292 [Lineus longissimus]|uniref:uncharacterized protein LOC135496292 n=1 Tax=Lineus longissimus TaxID=88925 RepID=UPI00315CE418
MDQQAGEGELMGFLRNVFPSMDKDSLQQITTTLVDTLGCDDVDDLRHATEADLEFLKPLRRRKLLAAISERFAASSSAEASVFLEVSNVSSPTSIPETDLEDSSRCSTPQLEQDFIVPWKKFPRNVMKKCSKNQHLTASETREVKRIVGDEMRALGITHRAAIRKAAVSMCNKYPRSFEDLSIDGSKLGDGFQSLFSGLENRVYNENYKDNLKRKSQATASCSDSSESLADLPVDQYGCRKGMWMPESPSEEEVTAQVEKKDKLKEMRDNDYDYEEVIKLMSETYYLQRKDICSGMDISELCKEWPFILSYKCLVNHFQNLTDINPQATMEESLLARNKGNRIYEFILSHPQKKKSGQLNKWVHLIKEEVKVTKSTDPQIPVDGSKKKVEEDKLKPNSPFIAIIGSREDIFIGRNLFYLVIEGSVVNDQIVTFLEAVISLFSCYYTLNLEYPEEAAVTLEFIQRELIGIKPHQVLNKGGKKKKKTSVAPKIVTLLRGIMDFESDWRTDE